VVIKLKAGYNPSARKVKEKFLGASELHGFFERRRRCLKGMRIATCSVRSIGGILYRTGTSGIVGSVGG
jgi:hypothetical protein